MWLCNYQAARIKLLHRSIGKGKAGRKSLTHMGQIYFCARQSGGVSLCWCSTPRCPVSQFSMQLLWCSITKIALFVNRASFSLLLVQKEISSDAKVLFLMIQPGKSVINVLTGYSEWRWCIGNGFVIDDGQPQHLALQHR